MEESGELTQEIQLPVEPALVEPVLICQPETKLRLTISTGSTKA